MPWTESSVVECAWGSRERPCPGEIYRVVCRVNMPVDHLCKYHFDLCQIPGSYTVYTPEDYALLEILES